MKKRSSIARSLSESKYRPRIVLARKGTKSYNRKRLKTQDKKIDQ